MKISIRNDFLIINVISNINLFTKITPILFLFVCISMKKRKENAYCK